MRTTNRLELFLAFFLASAPFAAAQAPGTFSGGSVKASGPVAPCVSAETIKKVKSDIAKYEAAGGIVSKPGTSDSSLPLLPFFPRAGNWGEDLTIGNYVDLDPAPGILDWNCSQMSYDGHAGHDAGVLTWSEMQTGVPVFAALDGTVLTVSDGYPDMNICNTNDNGNYIIIDHGNGWQTWYFHLKTGSTAVTPGQLVAKGAQIGLMGSSGYSCGPHLHFQVMSGATPYETFEGACNAGTTGWVAQPSVNHATVGDFAFMSAPPTVNLPAQTIPRTGEILTSGVGVLFWARIINLPANATFHIRYYQPDGTLAYDEPVYPFNNSTIYGDSWYWFWRDFWQLHTFTGEWRLKFEVNNTIVIDAPFQVVAQATGVNHAPFPASISLSPAAPSASDSIGCSVGGSPITDDPDYDALRYHYIWAVNGNIVRNVTTASRSDRLARGLAAAGDIVTCFVTPNDGSLDGTPAAASTMISGDPEIYDSISDPNSGLLTRVSVISLSAGIAQFATGSGPAGQLFTLGVADDIAFEIPLSVAFAGNPGSFVIDLFSAGFLTDPLWSFDVAGQVAIAVPVPNNPLIVGAHFRLQWLAYDPAAAPGGLFVLSNGLRVIVNP